MSSFDQFDIIAFIGPGAIVLAAFALLFRLPNSIYGDATTAVAFALVSYAAGHMVSGIGFMLMNPRRSWALRDPHWPLPHVGKDQLARFRTLLRVRLHRENPDECCSWPRRILYRQIYADVASSGRAGRTEIYNRLYNFYCGLAAAFLLIPVIALIAEFLPKAEHLPYLVIFLLAIAAIMLFIACKSQTRFYSGMYDTELLEQFLMLPAKDPDEAKA